MKNDSILNYTIRLLNLIRDGTKKNRNIPTYLIYYIVISICRYILNNEFGKIVLVVNVAVSVKSKTI